MTIDFDALALEVAGTDELTGDAIIEFARRYRAELAKKMEPVGYFDFDVDNNIWEEVLGQKFGQPLYSLEDWKK